MSASKNIFREQFDVIVSFNCLHWVSDQKSALIGISKAAVPGAQIAILLSHQKSLYHLVLEEVCSNTKWREYFTNYINPRLFFDSITYAQMLIDSGLEIVELSEEEMVYSFKSKEQLMEFFSAAGSQISQIPQSRKADFLNDFAAGYIAQSKSYETDFIPVGFWCLQVIALKPAK